MSTIIIITPPPRPLMAEGSEEKKNWQEQLERDMEHLRKAGFVVDIQYPE